MALAVACLGSPVVRASHVCPDHAGAGVGVHRGYLRDAPAGVDRVDCYTIDLEPGDVLVLSIKVVEGPDGVAVAVGNARAGGYSANAEPGSARQIYACLPTYDAPYTVRVQLNERSRDHFPSSDYELTIDTAARSAEGDGPYLPAEGDADPAASAVYSAQYLRPVSCDHVVDP